MLLQQIDKQLFDQKDRYNHFLSASHVSSSPSAHLAPFNPGGHSRSNSPNPVAMAAGDGFSGVNIADMLMGFGNGNGTANHGPANGRSASPGLNSGKR